MSKVTKEGQTVCHRCWEIKSRELFRIYSSIYSVCSKCAAKADPGKFNLFPAPEGKRTPMSDNDVYVP